MRRLRYLGLSLLLLMVWAVTLPSWQPGHPSNASAATFGLVALDAPGAIGVTADEWARLRYQAWLRGRQAATEAASDLPAVRAAATGPGAAAPAAPVAPVGGPNAIPALTLRAYREAAAWAEGFDAHCGLSWSVLAGIGRIESNHGLHWGASTRFTPNGVVSPRITGPPLDGRGVASIPDTDGGRWDGDTAWDRAVGPMQFIPSTWRRLGRDGNGDGVADPNDLFDAATSAAAYLCLAGRTLIDRDGLRRAVYAYNHSWDYVDAVLEWASNYLGGVTVGPPVVAAPPVAAPQGSGPSSTAPPPTTAPSTTTTTAPPPTTAPSTTTTTAPPPTTAPPTTTEPSRLP